MRTLIALLFLLVAAPVLAQSAQWERYDNARFGYTIEIPPGFDWGREADNGDGRALRLGATRLAVFGANLLADDFEAAAAARRGFIRDDGWALSYEAVTPGWASFSGNRGQRILYHRMIDLCGAATAHFTLEYSQVDRAEIDPLIARLVRSLRPTAC